MRSAPLKRNSLFLLLIVASSLAPAGFAFAHHGWSWTQSGYFRLSGVVREAYVRNPHATIDLDVEGVVWRVELAPPGRTTAAGVNEDLLAPGTDVVAIGNRSRDDTETRLKAVRIIVDGRNYDVYPDRAAGI